jgi:hypothetical protein
LNRLGGIGSQIAQRAQAFGMTVIDPKDMPLNPYVSRMVYPKEIDSVLPLADVLFISAPLTAKSQGMIGPRQFEMLKKGAYFVAVSRGKVYNTEALMKALDSRQLAGAGLDVTNPEPLPKEHALWKFDNDAAAPVNMVSFIMQGGCPCENAPGLRVGRHFERGDCRGLCCWSPQQATGRIMCHARNIRQFVQFMIFTRNQ